VAQKKEGLSRILFFGDAGKLGHIFNEEVEAAFTVVAEFFRRANGAPVPAMVMTVYDEACFLQNGNQFGVTANVFAQTMGDLQAAARRSSCIPSEARDRQAITAREMKFF